MPFRAPDQALACGRRQPVTWNGRKHWQSGYAGHLERLAHSSRQFESAHDFDCWASTDVGPCQYLEERPGEVRLQDLEDQLMDQLVDLVGVA